MISFEMPSYREQVVTEARSMLQEMLVLLGHPKAWTKRVSGKTADGTVVSGRDPKSVCWCLSGARQHIIPHELRGYKIKGPLQAAYDLTELAMVAALPPTYTGPRCYLKFNDAPTTYWCHIPQLLKRAIELCDEVFDQLPMTA